MKLVWLTYPILEISAALDTGRHDDLAVREIIEHIREGDVFEYLEHRLGDDIDLSLLKQLDRVDILGHLRDLCEAYGDQVRRKWGIENRGMCLMISWLSELIQREVFTDEDIEESDNILPS